MSRALSSTLPSMSSSMLRAGRSMPLQNAEIQGSNDLQSLESDDSSPFDGFDLDEAICVALKRSDLSHQSACLLMGVDQSLWTKQRAGDGHISFGRLLKLPRRFWCEFLPLVSGQLHLTVVSRSPEDAALLGALDLLHQIGEYALRTRASRTVRVA